MKIATYIKEVNLNSRGQQKLWRLDPPYESTQFIVTSHINNEFGNETLCFRSNEKGEIKNFLEISGSSFCSHERCILDIEYVPVYNLDNERSTLPTRTT